MNDLLRDPPGKSDLIHMLHGKKTKPMFLLLLESEQPKLSEKLNKFEDPYQRMDSFEKEDVLFLAYDASDFVCAQLNEHKVSYDRLLHTALNHLARYDGTTQGQETLYAGLVIAFIIMHARKHPRYKRTLTDVYESMEKPTFINPKGYEISDCIHKLVAYGIDLERMPDVFLEAAKHEIALAELQEVHEAFLKTKNLDEKIKTKNNRIVTLGDYVLRLNENFMAKAIVISDRFIGFHHMLHMLDEEVVLPKPIVLYMKASIGMHDIEYIRKIIHPESHQMEYILEFIGDTFCFLTRRLPEVKNDPCEKTIWIDQSEVTPLSDLDHIHPSKLKELIENHRYDFGI